MNSGSTPGGNDAATATPLEAYLEGVDPAAGPLVRDLDAAIRTAHPGFDVAIKYKLLTYALDGDWRTWVCALDARKNLVSLRFLYGVLLEDPLRVLRPGTSVLETWDIPLGSAVDAAAVTAYVREAVSTYADYTARAAEVQAAAKAAGPKRRRPPLAV